MEQHPYLEQVSLANNHIVRMNGISVVKKLNVLNLANNSIVNIEGLEELVYLTWLDLSGNSIKIISHLQHNTQLRHLDLSDNNIEVITDLSPLICLQTLLLHGNILNSLKPVPACLPASLAVLSLESNEIHDLTEISYLSCLENLEQLSIARNPCESFDLTYITLFDYRAYIINWCFRLKILDGYGISQKEKLLAEWLYSQGEGRHYRVGEHYQLLQYLSTVCPLSEELRTEEDAKLSRILNKQRYHHDQLLRQNEPIKAHILNRSHSHTGN
ncbi:hypothetical protein LOTGIDRAFT_210409 [Lottia gigantea]|uniref:Centrosomal protein of 97 kDa n=1 Tax=Lottia gigantea TaxID=225164 RepID=V3ZYB1_LOTGI|nr:hypothetical protein LOTGIDRAFT_210409 [Lottia gigantea]ESO89362.1 hypothetical protein LOTGIDRAFT_210409 [Lottia gigantea]